MPVIEELDDIDDLIIFPLTDVNDVDYSNNGDYDDDVMEVGYSNEGSGKRFRPLMSLKQRRRSMLSSSAVPIAIPQSSSNSLRLMRLDSGLSMSPRDRWKRAVRQVRSLSDPWAKFSIDRLPIENAKRHRYNAVKKKWVVDDVMVKMEPEPFNHGAMRACYRLKKLSNRMSYCNDWKQTAHNYVAKLYMEDVDRDVYFEDVRLQMDTKLWGEEYNRHRPPKKVDVLQMSVLEFIERPGKPLFHLEHYIDGNYIKYNSNSGFVEESVRFTPQAFSHFTFERSSHRLIVVDVQGVDDLWTDPQIHTCDGIGYGDGNLGVRGMALFFHSHACNPICHSLGLSQFDLALSERLSQPVFRKSQRTSAATRLRGVEEICCSVSPSEAADLSMFFYQRSRCISSASSGYSGEDEMNMDDRESIAEDDQFNEKVASPPPSLRRRHCRFLSESDDSSVSATVTEEEERSRFHMSVRSNSRPSCVAHEIDYRKLQKEVKLGTSILGEIHHALAKYHEMGRFILPSSGDSVDLNAALFHEQYAAKLGVKEAILTLACIYLQRPHSVLESISVEVTADNEEDGFQFMVQAAEAGDRSAMVYLAKAYETGDGLGIDREKSYVESVKWYQTAVETTNEDECGEFDATMDDPVYQLKASMAKLYRAGGFGLEKDPSYAGDLYTEAAEGATEAMKGRLANQYYALAEEAWAEVEEN